MSYDLIEYIVTGIEQVLYEKIMHFLWFECL